MCLCIIFPPHAEGLHLSALIIIAGVVVVIVSVLRVKARQTREQMVIRESEDHQ